MPVSAVLLSYLVLGELFSWMHSAGVGCVLLAMLLIPRDHPTVPLEDAERHKGGALTLQNIVPWGRSKAEYVAMFGLTSRDLSKRILDCAGGPASFNAEVTREGRGTVVSCDPIYHFSAEAISERIKETYADMVRSVRENADAFVWTYAGFPEQLAEARMFAMRRFLEDFPAGLQEGRYVAGGLPELPFGAGRFDLALSSHFLFTYSSQLSEEFHLASIMEMCRVAGEARVFPLLASSVHPDGNAGERSPHLEAVVEELRMRGYDARVERVAYEFQKGGNEMLRTRGQPD